MSLGQGVEVGSFKLHRVVSSMSLWWRSSDRGDEALVIRWFLAGRRSGHTQWISDSAVSKRDPLLAVPSRVAVCEVELLQPKLRKARGDWEAIIRTK